MRMTSAITALMGFFILSSSLGLVPTTLADSKMPPLSYQVTITGYNAVPAQTKPDPSTTASGALSNPDIIAARSVDLADKLPFGTVIAIVPSDTSSPDCGYPLVSDKIGLRVIADSMNARMHNKVDVLLGTDDFVSVGGKSVNVARALGVCDDVKIVVVGHIDISQIPKTQAKLAQMITQQNQSLALAK